MSKVTIVLDGQAGSCGKGKFIGYMALDDSPAIAINNFMSNAGHTWVDDIGSKVITQHLPTSLVNGNTNLVIGPGAAITPNILFDEITKYSSIIGDRKIIVNPRAMVIMPEHCERERSMIKSGSTFKGCGAAQADKIMRVPGTTLFGDLWNYQMNSSKCLNNIDSEALDRIVVMDTMDYINDAIDRGHDVLVEGSQGTDLDINYGLPYPHTTSRQCHAGQLVADCGISPRLVTDIVMIMRPYPIRISNTTNMTDESGNPVMISSGDYAGSKEITWDEVKKRCGAPDDIEFGEMTTVTKKTRRVFEIHCERLKYTVKLNRPTAIALNFVQYIDWDAYQCSDWKDLPQKVRGYILNIERETGVPVTLIGTGARNCDIIDLR